MNNFETFLDMITAWLKDHVLYILLTPYVTNEKEMANATTLWAWVSATIESHGCCGLSLATYVVNTMITNLWARVDFSQFKELLFQNLNKFTNVEEFYAMEFWWTCPFMYSEIYYSYIQPNLPF